LAARCTAGAGRASSSWSNLRGLSTWVSVGEWLVPGTLRLLRVRPAGPRRAPTADGVDEELFFKLEERFSELDERGIALSILSGRKTIDELSW